MAVPCEMLLHPELLSNSQLIQIIQERHLRVENLHKMRREDLLDLFHQFCVPYGQRKYRESGRGKILNKIRSSSPEQVTDSRSTVIKSNNSSIKLNRKTLHSDNERLKPPPDILSGQMKRIKLDSIASSAEDTKKNKRKMSIDTVPQTLDTTPVKKRRIPITWP